MWGVNPGFRAVGVARHEKGASVRGPTPPGSLGSCQTAAAEGSAALPSRRAKTAK